MISTIFHRLADSITEVDTSEMHFKESAEAEGERKKKDYNVFRRRYWRFIDYYYCNNNCLLC